MTIDDYRTVLHNVARDCDLGGRDQYEKIQFIQALLLGIEDDRVSRHLFERQDFTLEASNTCRAMESAKEDLRAV